MRNIIKEDKQIYCAYLNMLNEGLPGDVKIDIKGDGWRQKKSEKSIYNRKSGKLYLYMDPKSVSIDEFQSVVDQKNKKRWKEITNALETKFTIPKKNKYTIKYVDLASRAVVFYTSLEFPLKRKGKKKKPVKINAQIKEYRDGLDEETVMDKWPWLLNAKMKKAILGQRRIGGEIRDYPIVYDCVWEGGIFKGEQSIFNGVWKKGTFLDGVFESGTWYDGVWKNGIFKALWKNGIFENGTLTKTATWENGTFGDSNSEYAGGTIEGALWKNGVFKSGLIRYGTTWENGTFEHGRFDGGLWKDGIWNPNGDKFALWLDNNTWIKGKQYDFATKTMIDSNTAPINFDKKIHEGINKMKTLTELYEEIIITERAETNTIAADELLDLIDSEGLEVDGKVLKALKKADDTDVKVTITGKDGLDKAIVTINSKDLVLTTDEDELMTLMDEVMS